MNSRRRFFVPNFKIENLAPNMKIPESFNPVIDYTFKNGKAENINGTYTGEIIKCEYLNEYEGEKDVVHFKEAGSCIKIPVLDKLKYSASFGVELKIYPQKNSQTKGKRINLIEGQAIPFALMLEDVSGEDYFDFSASVHLNNGWNSINSDLWKYDKGGVRPFRIPKNEWTKIGVVFTGSDLIIFVSGNDIRRKAISKKRKIFKNSNLVSVGDVPYHIGTFVDGQKYQFNGYMSSVKIWDKVPALYYSHAIDEIKNNGQDEIVNKYAFLGGEKSFLGKPVSYYDEHIVINDVNGLVRTFEHGNIYWSLKTGAHEVHGDILKKYLEYNEKWGYLPYDNAINTNDIFIGFPVSDEMTGEFTRTRFSKFQNGAIYWSASTGACVLPAKIYAKYLALGGEKSFLGLPIELSNVNINVVKFEGGNIYDGYEGVFEVHGDILKKYSENTKKAGAPVSDESKILNEKGEDTGGRVASFVNGSIFWTGITGAVFVDYRLLNKYLDEGGPNGKLGYPLKDSSKSDCHFSEFSYELTMQDFENGIILYKKDANKVDIQVITKLEVYIEDTTCGQIDDGWWVPGVKRDCGPELYSYTYVKLIFFDQNGNKTYKTIDRGTRRPSSGNASDHIIMNKTYVIDSPKSNMWIELSIKYYDYDASSSNDYLGTMSMTFTPETCWGMFDPNNLESYSQNLTSYDSDHVSGPHVIKTHFSVRLPSVHDPNRCFRDQYWWYFNNFKKYSISYEFYANTFSDVSVDQNVIIHPIDYALYKLIYEDIAENGNCFGMCAEVMHVFANRSMFTFPLDKYKPYLGNYKISSESELPTPIHESITRKHMYQMSSKSIWHLMKKLRLFEAIKPLNVYDKVKKRLESERTVIISMLDLANGRGHSVLAYGIDESNNEKKILIADPNVPFSEFPGDNHPSKITIKDDNTFSHFSGLYKNDYFSNDLVYPILPGTLLAEIPYSVVSDEPSTPGWYVALALAALTGGLIILAGDASISQIKAGNKEFYKVINGEKRIVMDSINDFVRLPIVDVVENSKEIYSQQGEMQKQMMFEVVGQKNGLYSKIIKTSKASIMIDTKTNLNEQDKFEIDDMDTVAPYVKINTSSNKKIAKITYAFINDVLGLNDRKITVNLPISNNVESVFSMDTETGGIMLVSGVLQQEIGVTIDILVNSNIVSYAFSLVSNKLGETIKVIPQVHEYNKNIVIERGFEENGISEISRDIIALT